MIRKLNGMQLQIHPEAFVAETATIVGEVRIEKEASIWYGAVLRGDSGAISIGLQSSVEDNAVLHGATTVGSRVIIGHGAILHDCVVEDESMIGMGAVVMHEAVIGKGSLVAAGSLVTKGTIVPPGSLVIGSPARIAGKTSEEQKKYIREGALHYVALAGAQLPLLGGSPDVPASGSCL